jgi:hypothetical protein
MGFHRQRVFLLYTIHDLLRYFFQQAVPFLKSNRIFLQAVFHSNVIYLQNMNFSARKAKASGFKQTTIIYNN